MTGTPSTLARDESPKLALKEVPTNSPAAVGEKEDGDSSDCFSDIELPA